MSFAFEPFDPELRRDPYPTYRRLRDESPVHFSPQARCWIPPCLSLLLAAAEERSRSVSFL